MTAGAGGGVAAVVGAVASEPRAAGSDAADFWSLLVNARDSEQLCRAWLGILCQWVPGAQDGVLLLHGDDDQYAPAAVWPDPQRDLSHLAPVAEQALAERRGVVLEQGNGLAQCAYPLLTAESAYGVVVLHVAARGGSAMREVLRILHWGAGWLVGLFDRRRLAEGEQRLDRSALLQDLVLGVLAEPGAQAAARWVVNRLVQGLPCRQALLGRCTGDGGELRLLAVSGSAGFDAHSNLLAAALDALREGVLAGCALRWPPPAGDAAAPTLAHDALHDYVQEAQAQAGWVLPLQHAGRCTGALLLDFDQPAAPALEDFGDTLAAALGPALAVHDQATRGLWAHARARSGTALRALLGPARPGLKLLALAAAGLLVAAALWPVDYRVAAPATVEGRVQRALVAPFDGYILESRLRAGDRVAAGDTLARLDDRDLRLEEAKWLAQAELGERKLREAMALGKAVDAQLAQAQVDEAAAELALVRSKLARAALVAPFDGVIVRGDLSQQLGAPVEQGKVLFEVAPLAEWRVVLRVDERDILQVHPGAHGELVLSGLPGESHGVQVTRVAPMAVAEEGRTAFRVEAQVQGTRAGIQPGMEGIGKVEVGERSLLWVAGHRLVDWLRYALWTIGW